MRNLHKRILILIVVLLVLILAPFSVAFGCEVSIVPAKTEVSVNEVISVEILRTQTHKTCVLPLDATKIEITGGEIVGDYPWIEGTPDKKTIEVRFTELGDGVIKVTRDCPKGGLMVWTAAIKVVSPSASTQTTQPTDSATTPQANTENPTGTDSTNQIASPSQSKVPTPESNQTVSTDSLQNTGKDDSSTNDNSTTIQGTQTQKSATQQATSASRTSILLKNIFSTQNTLYITLLVLGLILFIKKKFKLRYLPLLVSLAVLGFYFGGCSCPMGFVEKIWLNPIGSALSISVLIILGIITVATLFKGRIFCGWVCPHGALQEFLFQKKVAIKINPKVDRMLKYIKYFVLVFIIVFALVTGTSILCKIEPFKAIYNLTATGIVLALVVATLVASVFIYRPWCRYVCPFGAYLGIVSWIGGKLHLNKTRITNTCLLCKSCLRVCPANSIVDKGNGFEIDYKECFTCGDCTDSCSQNRTKK